MNHEDKVRYRNDGDDFHIVWTARRALKLLDPASKLVAVAVEGISNKETGNSVIHGGLLGIDTALYYGSEAIDEAEKVEYCQLKYSTTTPKKAWSAQEISEVIEYFGARYLELIDEYGKELIHKKVRFQFVTNRPISTNIVEGLYHSDATAKHAINARNTLRAASRTKNRFPSFIKLLDLHGHNDNRHEQSNQLSASLIGMTSSHDPDVEIRLKDLIHSKTLSDTRDDPVIRLPELLLKFGVDDKSSLLPAPSEIEENGAFFSRTQEKDLVTSIHNNRLTVLHAEGGIGKSVIVSQLAKALPVEFHCVVFDGFGGGSYRQETSPRHRFDFGLIQIANELAYAGLCDPIIPISGSEDHRVFKKFTLRLEQSITSLKASSQNSKLVLVFDAIDNIVMGAELAHDTSFVNAVLNEIGVKDVHILAVARTERLKCLPLPQKSHSIQLNPFTLDETKRHVLSRLNKVDDYSIQEFHSYTRGVPRVQAYYLERVKNKKELLKIIRGDIKSSDELIGDEVQLALNEIKKFSDTPEQINLLCIALAELPPLVPIHILSNVAGVDEQRVKSFINDLKYPLRISDDGVQFRDEPVETWFRNNFNAEHKNFEQFVSALTDKSFNDPYVATTFPRLLFQVGHFDELVQLSLGDNLDFDDPIIKRETFKRRIEYSLKACLVTKKYDLACKLLFRYSEEVETTDRQSQFIQKNYALLSVLASSSKVADVLFRKHKDDWYGIEQGRKAAIMSPHEVLHSECLQSLEMAEAWLQDYFNKPKEEFHREEFDSQDIAAICFAILFIRTPESVVDYIARWKPKLFQTQCSYKLGINLLMHSPFPDSAFFKVAEAAIDEMHILIGLIVAADEHQVSLPKAILSQLSKQLSHFDGEIESWHRSAAVILAENMCHESGSPTLSILLEKYAWPLQDGYFASYGETFDVKEWGMRFFSLASSFKGVDLSPEAILLPKEKMRNSDNYDKAYEKVSRQIEYFGRVYEIRAKLLFGTIDKAQAFGLFESLLSTIRSNCYMLKHSYDLDANSVVAFLTKAVFSAMCNSKEVDCGELTKLLEQIESIELFQPASIRVELAKYLCQFSSSEEVSVYIMELLASASERLSDFLESASDKAQTYANISKVALVVSHEDANAYLDIAFEALEQLDHNSREMLDACCLLANEVGADTVSRPEDAYRLARVAELIHSMNDHKFPWGSIVKSITYLSPESSLAIISRWRERKVGWIEENIEVATRYLAEIKAASPSMICALEVYGEHWDYAKYFSLLLHGASSFEERERIYNLLISDVKSDRKEFSTEVSKGIESVVKEFQLPSFNFEEIAARREGKKKEQYTSHNSQREYRKPKSVEFPAYFNNFLESFSFDDERSLLSLINRLEHEDKPRSWNWADVFSTLRAKLTVSQRARYFQSLSECNDVDHDELLKEIDVCCHMWKASPAVKKLIPRVIDGFIQQRGVDIVGSWYMANRNIENLAALTQQSEAEIFTKILGTITSHIDALPSNSLQYLLRQLYQYFKIDNKEDVLRFVLQRFERYCGGDVADGNWRNELTPPSNMESSIAGFIWCGLASPESEFRWRSAHMIKRLCYLQQEKVIIALFDLLKGGSHTAYRDNRLPFYKMHAEMHFLMVVAREVHNYPLFFSQYSDTIFKFATEGEPHVFIREYAKVAALVLYDFDNDLYTPQQVDLLSQINTSVFPKAQEPKTRAYRRTSIGKEESNFHFTNDMDRYWFPNLSDVFGFPTTEIEKMASDLIVGWGGSSSWVWKDDLRAKQQLYSGESHSTHGSYPETDRLSFYYGLHAMAIVAGQLLAEHPVLEDDYDGERFESWLNRHIVSVDTSKWQADRRNGCPLPKRPWMGKEYNDEDWKWAVSNQDFMDILLPESDFIQLYSEIVFSGEYGKSERVHITSALVTPKSSLALIRSLQLEPNHHIYSIPLLGQDSHDQENHVPDFNMSGYINRREREYGIEQFDPMAGDIDYPPVSISSDVVNQCQLVEVEDGVWSRNGETEPAFIAEIWGKWHRDKRDRGKGKGERLIANIDELCSCLKIIGKDIVIEVVIDRDNGRNDGYPDYQYDDYVKIFVLKADGYLYELRRCTLIGSKIN
ncbi:ATP-binding protein [Pseudoalteromonas rubra]|uniref:ATP-binding protein n=1 Tax=Pseudoalteromonas rubra TaxID=43658 RepID=A0A0F4QU93_9GAMM|nr:ATP-binding protein [Pseudoalteromonas rubra]KJZ10187.1 hypothetical protein TW77_08135 [Pseudoalteromonas rubra]